MEGDESACWVVTLDGLLLILVDLAGTAPMPRNMAAVVFFKRLTIVIFFLPAVTRRLIIELSSCVPELVR